MNRGKKFEDVVRESFEHVLGVSIDRIHDQTNGYRGSQNICDFIVYRRPFEYYIECKSIHGNTFPLSNITKTQWDGLVEKSQIPGVFAGVLCWWVDRDVTAFMPMAFLQYHRECGYRSVSATNHIDNEAFNHRWKIFLLPGKKKRVFFDYDMERFFDYFEMCGAGIRDKCSFS